MKQGISATTAIVVILVVVVVVSAVGYFAFLRPKKDVQVPVGEEMQADMEKMGKFGGPPEEPGAGNTMQADMEAAGSR